MAGSASEGTIDPAQHGAHGAIGPRCVNEMSERDCSGEARFGAFLLVLPRCLPKRHSRDSVSGACEPPMRERNSERGAAYWPDGKKVAEGIRSTSVRTESSLGVPEP